MAFGYSARLIRHLCPDHKIGYRYPYRQVHQSVQQGRIDDRAHASCLAASMFGDVDDRVSSDAHPEQHDPHRHARFAVVRRGQRSWRTGNQR